MRGPERVDFALAAAIGFAGGIPVLALGLLARVLWRPPADPRFHRRFLALLGTSFAIGLVAVAATVIWAPRTIAAVPLGTLQIAIGLVISPVILVWASGFPFSQKACMWMRRQLPRDSPKG
jgi:hypothetical protein